MPKNKSTGKKLADMMYGNPEGAAFGITPMIGKRREDRQDREAAKSFPVDLARGVVAGAVGLPGDIESLARLPYELISGNESPTFLPTSEDVLKRIPFGTNTPAGQFASGLGTLAGGSANIGALPRAIKAAPGALKTAARNLSTPRTMSPEAGAVRIKAPSAPQERAMRLAQQRAALPVEQGGLGLPANNTAEQRAIAMGFDRDTFHGSLRDINKLDPRLGSTESHAGRGVYSTDSPEDASLNYASIYGPDVTGRVERGLEERDKDFRKIYGRMRDEVLTPRQQEIILRNTAGADNLGVVYPLKVRADKSIHLDAPEANPVRIGPFESYDEVADAYVDTPHTAKFREALDEFGELGGEANPIYEVVQDGDGPVPARDVFNAVKKTGNESGLYDPYTGEIVSGGVAAGDFVKHFGIDEIRHTPEFRNQQLNIGNEHTISLNPDNVRSRFAAFDPFRKDVATAAAMGVLAPDLLAKEKDEGKKKDKEKDKETKKASGGRVHFSDNPDVMALELQAGGLVKGLKAAAKASKAEKELALPPVLPRAPAKTREEIRPYAQRMAQQMTGEFYRPNPKKSENVAGKSFSQFKMEKGLEHDIRPTREVVEPEVADIEKQLGMLKIGISGDTTIADKVLRRAGPYELFDPSPQHGGPRYGLGGEGAWASNNPIAATVQKRVNELSEAYGAPPLGQYMAMGPQGSNFAQHFADANLQAIDTSAMTKAQIEQINKLIRQGSQKSGPRPSFPGIEDRGSAYLHFAIDPELRKHFNDLMQKTSVTEKLNLPDGRIILHAITEPELRDKEILNTGFSQMRLKSAFDPESLQISAHPTYSHVIPHEEGSAVTRTKYLTPGELEFSDVLDYAKQHYRPQDMTRVFQTSTPRQIVDPQHIDEMKMYEELMKEYTGKKAGGAVRKAAGGEITADDLILEERKL